MAEGMDESIPSYVMEALLDSFSESDSDVGDISGDFSGNANDESQPDLLGSYSDVASDDDNTVETYDLGTVLSFIDDDDLPEYDFKKNRLDQHVQPHLDVALLWTTSNFSTTILSWAQSLISPTAMQQLVSLPETSRTGSGPTFPCKS